MVKERIEVTVQWNPEDSIKASKFLKKYSQDDYDKDIEIKHFIDELERAGKNAIKDKTNDIVMTIEPGTVKSLFEVTDEYMPEFYFMLIKEFNMSIPEAGGVMRFFAAIAFEMALLTESTEGHEVRVERIKKVLRKRK